MKFAKILLGFITLISISGTYAYYKSSNDFENKFTTKDYNLQLNANGGSFSNSISIVDDRIILPEPIKDNFSFMGYSTEQNGDVEYSLDNDYRHFPP